MINRYSDLPILLSKLDKYNSLFSNLNNKPYHISQKSKKLQVTSKNSPYVIYKAIYELKIELYSYKISLEEIIDTIDEFNERIDNE